MEIIEILRTVITDHQAQFIGFMFSMLILFITADIITGWLKGWHTGNLDSAKNFRGYIRKATIIVLAIVGIMLELTVAVALMFLQMDNINILGLNMADIPLIATVMLVWLCLGEILSIAENMSGMGVRMPKFMEDGIKRINNNVDDGKMKIKTVAKENSKDVTIETKISKKGDTDGNL